MMIIRYTSRKVPVLWQSASHCIPRLSTRCLSGRNRKNQNSSSAFSNTLGISYSISPERALEKFQQWAIQEQGLGWLLRNVAINAVYAPVWSFDLNVRFRNAKGKVMAQPPPVLAAAYGTQLQQSVIHLPGMSAYAGYTYRRSLMDPVHSATLLFMKDKSQPFHAYMLKDMQLSNGATLSVFPDPWNASKARALMVVRDSLSALGGDTTSSVDTQMVAARRVYMPTYVIHYTVLGMEYQAFVSGCDDGAAVSGISHKVFDVSNDQVTSQAASFIATTSAFVQSALQTLGGRNVATIVTVTLQFAANFLARIIARIPLVTAVGGAFVGFRKLVRPWMDNRTASAEWERQREHEATRKDTMEHFADFEDDGSAERYFRANRESILRNLAGDQAHKQGSYDWYASWEQWAREQWEQQQQQQQQQGQHQQGSRQSQSRTRQRSKQNPKREFKWDFDPNDPYSVLGIRRGATATEVSAAFRKQMLLHHPDTKANASEAERARAEERSKLLTNAYQTIKASMKR